MRSCEDPERHVEMAGGLVPCILPGVVSLLSDWINRRRHALRLNGDSLDRRSRIILELLRA